jgi:hypothetical protein
MAEFGENLVEALDLIVGIDHVGLKSGLQIGVGRHVGHFRNRLGELLLGVIDVLQLMEKHVFHGFDVFGEDAHVCLVPLVIREQNCRQPDESNTAAALSFVVRKKPLPEFWERSSND